MAKQAAATTEVDVTDLLEAIGQLNAKLEDALNRVETLAESSAGIRNTVFNVNERLVAVESNVSATEAAGAGIPSEAYSGITVPQVFLLMLQTAVRAQIERHASSFGAGESTWLAAHASEPQTFWLPRCAAITYSARSMRRRNPA